ncbi:multidrug resistance-like protein [Hortaea werneckii]|nr:multidrug resistance-like protein [Hortaea werneckii]
MADNAAYEMRDHRPSCESHQRQAESALPPRPSRDARPSSVVSTNAAEPFQPEPTLDPAHPREWHAPITTLSRKVYAQILGLNPFKTSYVGLYRLLDSWWDRSIAGVGVCCAIAAGVPLPIIALIFGHLISSFPPSENDLQDRISQLLGVAVAYFVVTAAYASAFGFTGEKIACHVRDRLLKCLLHVDQEYLDTHEIDANSLLTDRVDSIHAGCSEKVGIFIQSISYFVAAFTVGFVLSAKLTGILLAAVVPTIFIIIATTSRTVSKLAKNVTTSTEAANKIVESALAAVKTVQAFGMMAEMRYAHEERVHDATKASIRKAVVAAVQVGCIFFTAYAINALAFWTGSRFALSGESGGKAGTIFAVVLLILDSSLVVAQFAPLIDIFARAAAAKESMQELLDAGNAVARAGKVAQDELPHYDLAGKKLRLEKLSFAYPARPSVNVLNAVDLELAAGSFTAIVGPSGSGKSTLCSLLTRIYDYQGSIWAGQTELRSLQLTDLRKQIAVLEQEAVLFPGTVRENICNGLDQSSLSPAEIDAECDRAVRAAAVDFLDKLPRGIDTMIGDGLQISGGQRQRICLARALIRRPAFLVLDEPTAALDAVNELGVMEAIKNAKSTGCTVLMIAHRLSTVVDADHVVVMCDGSIVEQGTPQSLAEAGGTFKSLLNAQNTTVVSDSSAESSTDDLAQVAAKRETGEKGPAIQYGKLSSASEETVEAQKPLSALQILAHVWHIIRPDFPITCLGLCASMTSGALLLGEAIIFGHLIQLLNEGVGNANFTDRANFLCLMFFVLACVALLAWVTSGTTFGATSARSVERIQKQLFRTLLDLDLTWYAQSERSVGQLMSAFTKDSGDLSCLSGPVLGTIFTTSTSMIGGTVLALAVAWKIAVVLLAAVPVVLAAGYTRLQVLNSADNRRRSAYRSATGFAVQVCQSRRTVAVYGLEDRVLEKYHNMLRLPFKKSQVFTAWSNILLAASFAITYFVYALAYWWGSKLVRRGEYSGLEFFIVLPALLFSAQSSGQLFSLSPEIARARAAARSIFQLLSQQPVQTMDTCKQHSTDMNDDKSGTGQGAGIRFDNVAFSYPTDPDTAVLQNLSIAAQSGQTIALVGPSGAGKSSTVALLERFYDPTAGDVVLNGSSLRSMDLQVLRDKISLVSQEPDLFPGSIAYNVKLGRSSRQTVTDADVEHACRQCGLHDFITSLPEGYNTECGSAGSSRLSGGQRQRVAIARALIRNPEVLLLDEPTSALDAHSEQLVKRSLEDAAQGRTTVVVAHRLASIQHAHRIYVLDQGTVVEEGSHEELVKKGGLYSSMAKAQSIS